MATNKFNPSNITPNFKGWTSIQYMRFWCQKVLPAIYDNSLSYYEALCKMAALINQMIDELGDMEDNIDEMLKSFQELQKWLNSEVERFEKDMEARFAAHKTEIKNLFDQYKSDADTYINEQLTKYKTDTTSWLTSKFNTLKSELTTQITNLFNQYKDETNAALETWKTNFEKTINDQISAINTNIANMKRDILSLKSTSATHTEQISNINSALERINSKLNDIDKIINTKFPKFELLSVTGTGTKYYKRCIVDFLSFPSDADQSILCYGIVRTFGMDNSVAVSGNWHEQFLFDGTPGIADICTRLGRTTQNCIKLELTSRVGYVSESGNSSNGAPISSVPIMGLMWLDASGKRYGQLYIRNSGSVGFVSDASYLFSAIVTNQVNPPTWTRTSGEWSN